MKYIPLERFEAINSLLSAVEYQPGTSLTIRLEAFTCRNTKEERHIAAELANYRTQIQSTPPVSPAPGIAYDPGAPPVLVLGGTTQQQTEPAVVEADVDERLVFCVAALNNLYQDEGYDFAVLSDADFISHSEAAVVGEIDFRLQQLPPSCSSAAHDLWPAVKEVVGTAADGCEFFEFRCPSCDPLAEAVDPHTYFLYNKRKKVLVSLLMYAEQAE
eukprot:gene1691-1053_t